MPSFHALAAIRPLAAARPCLSILPAVGLLVAIVLFPPAVPAADSTSPAPKVGEDHLAPLADNTLRQRAAALTKFDGSLLAGEKGKKNRSIADIMQDIESLKQDYLDNLQGRRSSYGLYSVGEFDEDIENNETRYAAGLELKLFNDGYYEAVRRDAQKILEARLEFYQLRRDMIDKLLEDDLYNLFAIENYINVKYYREKESALAALFKKRTQQLKNGYTTEIDVLDIRRQLASARNSLAFYEQSSGIGLTAEQSSMLNSVEIVRLKPASTLTDLARTNSDSLKIQDNLIDRAEFFPTWTENVALNVNAEYRHEFLEEDRTIVGVEVEIPLTFDRKRDSLIDTQKRIYRYQKEAVNRRLQQQVEKLCLFYRYQQQRLTAQQDNLELLLLKSRKNETKNLYSIQQLEDDPARNLDLLAIDLIDSRYEALQTRLKIYEILLKLMALTQAKTVTSLFEFD